MQQRLREWSIVTFDIETNGLDPDVIHCLVVRCMITNKVRWFTAENMQEGLDLLAAADQIIGHNVIAYDIPSLQKVYPQSFHLPPAVKITDTLVLSRLLCADMTNDDFEADWAGKGVDLPKRLYGSHSLQAWGLRMGSHKGDYTGGWETFSEEMLEYCIQDTAVTAALYRKFMDMKPDQTAVDFAHELATVCDEVGKFGWTFDVKKATELYGTLAQRRADIERELHDLFEPWEIHEEFIPKRNNKTLGYVEGEVFTKVKTVQFNPNSRRHIEFCLRRKYNWKPKLLTAQGHAQIDETVLGALAYPEAQRLAEFFMIQKRIGQLAEGRQAWLKLQQRGKLRHNIISQGTVTHRAAHRNCNLAQVPASRLPYGKECRELFTVADGYVLLGADLSGIEARCLAFYLNDDQFTKELLDGDIHTANQKAAGLSSRDQAKTFFYAYMYGAGAAKIGSVVGGGIKEGRELLDRFNANMPAIRRLRAAVEAAAERGYLVGLDNRHIKIRSQHKALNSLLQGAGATIAGQWLINTNKAIKEQGLDANIMAWVHDELQIQVREKDAEHVGDIVRRSAEEAGRIWDFEKVPIEAEYSIGRSWADTH
jgi:DNA polymerase-1